MLPVFSAPAEKMHTNENRVKTIANIMVFLIMVNPFSVGFKINCQLIIYRRIIKKLYHQETDKLTNMLFSADSIGY